MVLCTQVRLDALAACTAPLVDVLAGAVTAHEADSLYRRVVADGIDSWYGAVNDVEHAGGEPCTLAQLGDDHGSTWISF